MYRSHQRVQQQAATQSAPGATPSSLAPPSSELPTGRISPPSESGDINGALIAIICGILAAVVVCAATVAVCVSLRRCAILHLEM